MILAGLLIFCLRRRKDLLDDVEPIQWPPVGGTGSHDKASQHGTKPLITEPFAMPTMRMYPSEHSQLSYAGSASPPSSADYNTWRPHSGATTMPRNPPSEYSTFSSPSMDNASISTGPLSSAAPTMSQYDPSLAAMAQARVGSPAISSSSGREPYPSAVTEKQALAFDLYAQQQLEQGVTGSSSHRPGPGPVILAPPAYTESSRS